MFSFTKPKEKLKTLPGKIITALAAVMLFYVIYNWRMFGKTANWEEEQWRTAFFILLFAIVLTYVRFLWWGEHRKETRTVKVYEYVLYTLFFAVFWHIMVENIVNYGLKDVDPHLQHVSMMFCGILFLLLLLILESLRAAACVGSVLYYVFALSEFFTIQFRNIPIQFSDLFDVRTAAAVAGNYKYEVDCRMVTFGILTVLILFNLFLSPRRLTAGKLSHRLVISVAGVCLLVGGLSYLKYSDYMEKTAGEINGNVPLATFRSRGIQLCFIKSWLESEVKMPKGYEDFDPDEFGGRYRIESAERETEDTRPDIIVIMNETFADVDIMGLKGFAETVIPNYTALSGNVQKGKTMVSTLGGGTGKSEYEFLTGNSMHLYQARISPYVRLGTRLRDSLASQMKQQGYQTYALHPFTASNYNRARTYETMGFDRFFSWADFPDMEMVRDFCSDRSCYEKIYELTDTEEPVFTFCVTIQNHSPYTYEDFDSQVHLEGIDCPEAEQYLTLIQMSDQMLGELIDHYSHTDKPTIIVFFGDHFPSLPDEFWEYVTETKTKDQSPQVAKMIYATPYFMWANYPVSFDIDENENEVLGLNELGAMTVAAAGLKTTPYQEYILSVRDELPAFSAYSWYGEDGLYHGFDADKEAARIVTEYDCVQYNELFDEKHRLQDFFSLPDRQSKESIK